jgi:hypothetical protein
MTWRGRGHIQNGAIVLAQAAPLPNGTEVDVRIESTDAPRVYDSNSSFTSLPFFGMWSDRQDLEEADQWLRNQREQWHQRGKRPA